MNEVKREVIRDKIRESVGDIASQIPIDESTYIPAFGKAVAKPEEKLKINIYICCKKIWHYFIFGMNG